MGSISRPHVCIIQLSFDTASQQSVMLQVYHITAEPPAKLVRRLTLCRSPVAQRPQPPHRRFLIPHPFVDKLCVPTQLDTDA